MKKGIKSLETRAVRCDSTPPAAAETNLKKHLALLALIVAAVFLAALVSWLEG